MRASLIRGNLVIVTVNIDIDDNTGLVRFFTEFTSLLLLALKTRGLPVRQQQGDIAALYPKFAPAQIRLPKQFVLLGPTPNHLTRSQRNTHTY